MMQPTLKPDLDELVTAFSAAAQLGVPYPTLLKWIHRGDIWAKRVGGVWLVRLKDVMAIQRQRIKWSLRYKHSDMDGYCWVSVDEASRIVGLSPTTIRTWVARGTVKSLRIGWRKVVWLRDVLLRAYGYQVLQSMKAAESNGTEKQESDRDTD